MFKLVFETKNAAFEEYPEQEVIRILNETIAKLMKGDNIGHVFDINGNKIGTYSLVK